MKSKVQAFIYSLSNGNQKFFWLILISAVFVVLARIIGPFEVYWDQAIQLEAAQRLVRGLGLTSTYFSYASPPYSPNINQPPRPPYLTWFPPGFSLVVASLLSFKLSLAGSLKILYGVITVIGWLGWAIIGCHLLSKPIRLGTKSFSVQFWIATILPIFYTPPWWGTDIFLWSGIPYIIIFLYNSVSSNPSRGFLSLSGVILGLLYSFRYSSLFLVISTFLILFYLNSTKINFSLLKKYLIFIASSFVFTVPIFIYNRTALSNTGLPEYVTTSRGLEIFSNIDIIFSNLSQVSVLSGIPLITEKLLSYLKLNTAINYVYGVTCLVILSFLPLIIIRTKRLDSELSRKNIAIFLSFLPISLVLFLIACMFAADYNFLGDSRYYIPVSIGVIYTLYELATLQNTHRIIKIILSIFFLIFLVYNLLYLPRFLLTGQQGFIAQTILGITPLPNMPYPSNIVFTKYEYSSQILRQLKEDNSEAILFTQFHPFYIYNSTYTDELEQRFRPIPDVAFWKQAYLSKATKIFWVTNNPACPGICSTFDIEQEIKQLSSLPNLQTIFTDPYTQTKIMVSDLPSGYKFSE
jgi:hypothetical protein